MAKVSKSIILAYNKCAELANKFTNILDSFWHKDEKIPLSALEEDITVEVIDNLTSTDVDKPLSANQGKVLKDQQDGNSQNINTNEQQIQNNASSIINLENDKLDAGQYQGTADDFSVRANDEIIIGLKAFLYDKLGFRNFANTFTSYLRNSNTASRYYTFQNRNGIIADDTDLATKQDKFSGIINRIPRSISEFGLGVSRLFDDGSFFGIGTVYSPSKDVTLGNQFDREIGIEESDANTKGRNLTVSAGRANDYRTNEGFTSILTLGVSIKSMAISPTTNDFYVLGTNDHLYKQTASAGSFIDLGLIDSGTQQIHISATNDLFITVNNFTANAGLLKQTNCTGSFVNIYNIAGLGGITTRDDNNKVVVTKGSGNDIFISDTSQSNFSSVGFVAQFNGKASLTYSNGDVYCAVSATNKKGIFKQIGGVGGFVDVGANDTLSYTGITTANNGNTYASTTVGIFEQVNSVGAFSLLVDTVRNYSAITCNKTTGSIYASVGSELFELSFSQKGTPDLDGGTLKLKAGTGKGTGQSRIEFITGNKLPSGTDMQPETVRGYIDENGWFIYYYPEFADNAAAISAGLPSNAIYKDNNGNLKSVFIPQ